MTLHAVPVVALQTQFGQWVLLRLVLLIAVLPLLRRDGDRDPDRVGGRRPCRAAADRSCRARSVAGRHGTDRIRGTASACRRRLAGRPAAAVHRNPLPAARRPQQPPATASRRSAFRRCCCSPVPPSCRRLHSSAACLACSAPPTARSRCSSSDCFWCCWCLRRSIASCSPIALPTPPARGGQMRCSIAAEMVLGALVVIAAAILASLTPGTHEQPVWPLPWRPNLARIRRSRPAR